MDTQAGRKLPRGKAPRTRRALLAFLALTYLFVGFAHTVTCTDEAVALALVSDVGGNSGGAPDEGDTKKSPLVVEHCYVCTPFLMPALVPVAAPSAHALENALIAPIILLAEHPRLDTPPPKI